MERIRFYLGGNVCEIIIGYNVLDRLKDIFKANRCFVVVDKFIYENFYNLYFEDVLHGIDDKNIYLFESAENNKDISKIIDIIEKLSFGKFLRDTCLVGIGGGIVGDIIGFISSIYMRGIKLINVPTTLLSQIDSSIGGKNAINMHKCKNLIGTFKQPNEIIIDINFLKTLSRREIVSGLAEVIKYGIIFEFEFLQYIEKNLSRILSLDVEVLKNIIVKSCNFKMSVVEKDEHDIGLRKILNFGHTLGHALESITNYSLYTHGEAVLIGMFYEICMAYELNLIDSDYFNFLKNILSNFRVSINEKIFNSEAFYELLLRDKKNSLDKVSFILPVAKSKVLEYKFCLDEIRKINYSKYRF